MIKRRVAAIKLVNKSSLIKLFKGGVCLSILFLDALFTKKLYTSAACWNGVRKV